MRGRAGDAGGRCARSAREVRERCGRGAGEA